ncbi:hypothetical protein GOODEAATRI_017071 [Goodea atripinnis]|uniref:Symplekin/Pta1 N-terminal domain-containing protein n=1 Tax=Goodea atripinnis TaxID=208336 RepID=A0ABV0PYP7_9TELE
MIQSQLNAQSAADRNSGFFQVVELLNQAALIPTDEKLNVLKQEIIAFQTDRSNEVRKFVIGFIEEAWYTQSGVSWMPLSFSLFLFLFSFRQWLVHSKTVSEMQEACWDLVTQMTGDVLTMLDSENDGIRTHAIKFTESLIITLSPRTPESDVPKRQEGDISLDKVPRDHSYIRYGTHPRVWLEGNYEVFKNTFGPVLKLICSVLDNPQTPCQRRGRLPWRNC